MWPPAKPAPYIAPASGIVACETFVRALVKLQRGHTDELSIEEREAVACLRTTVSEIISQDHARCNSYAGTHDKAP